MRDQGLESCFLQRLVYCEPDWLFLGVFFFHAEDGIRSRDVTGVQTCALPICSQSLIIVNSPSSGPQDGPVHDQNSFEFRSEERRVGKSVDLVGRRIIKKK